MEDGADVEVTLLAQRAEDPQGRIDERRLLHVEANEVAEPRSMGDELADVRACELLVEREAEVRQLERHVDLEPLGRDPVEDLPVGDDDRARLGLVRNALSEDGCVGLEAFLVQPSQDDDRVVERLAGDEARRSEAHPVPAHHALKARALGGGEDRLSQHGHGGTLPLRQAPNMAAVGAHHVHLRLAWTGVSGAEERDPFPVRRPHGARSPAGFLVRRRWFLPSASIT